MKLNATKTQMMVIDTPGMLRDVLPASLSFCGTVILESMVMKNLVLCLTDT